MTLSHKDMTAHIRKRLKVAGVGAKCSKYVSCGVKYIRVSVPDVSTTWTPEETKTIRNIADANKLTGARKSPINMTDGYMANVPYASFHFEFWG